MKPDQQRRQGQAHAPVDMPNPAAPPSFMDPVDLFARECEQRVWELVFAGMLVKGQARPAQAAEEADRAVEGLREVMQARANANAPGGAAA